VPIKVIEFVTRVELHEPFRRYASHRVSADHSSAGQVLAAVRHPAHVVARCIERVRVNVKTPASVVGQNEVAFPAIVAVLLAKPSRAEERAKAGHLGMRHSNVEVIMRPGLLSEESIHSPSAINMDFQAVLFQEVDEIGNVPRSHPRSLVDRLKVSARLSGRKEGQ